MLPNNTDSGFTNIMQDEKVRKDYLDSRYARLEKGLSKRNNLRVLAIFLIAVGIFLSIWAGLGVGYRPSGATKYALKQQLIDLYGEEYTEKITDYGTEDMEFHINPKTLFPSNWNFRHFFSMPYEYECQVVFKTYDKEGNVKSKTITYQAFDPMGYENAYKGAYIVLDSMEEIATDPILLTK